MEKALEEAKAEERKGERGAVSWPSLHLSSPPSQPRKQEETQLLLTPPTHCPCPPALEENFQILGEEGSRLTNDRRKRWKEPEETHELSLPQVDMHPLERCLRSCATER